MDTYGDMVTLLLCFFVLLYSMSTISEDNWKAIVMSFNPLADQTIREVKEGNTTGPSSDPGDSAGMMEMQEQVDEDIEMLFQALQEYVQQQNSEQTISVEKDGGKVFISVYRDGDQVLLEVGDTGVGIPEADLPKVFNRFYRVDKARSRAAGGTGLGLSIVRDTVRRHGGWVTVRPRNPEGSVFTAGFPRYVSQPEGKGEGQ